MKIATIDDVQEILEMSMNFMKETEYSEFSSEDSIRSFIEGMVTAPQHACIILLEPGVGFLAGHAVPFPFGPHILASEIAWWVNPEHRGKKVGSDFLAAFEYWAKEKAGCTMVSMVCLDDSVSKYYDKQGYKLYERAYMKVL